jgi:leucyl aminopeptidase
MSRISLVSSTSSSLIAIPYATSGVLANEELSPSASQLELYGAKAKTGTVAKLPLGQGALMLIGVGDKTDLREFGATVARENLNCSVVAPVKTLSELHELVEGLLLGGKTPTRYRKDNPTPASYEVVVPAELVGSDLSGLEAVCSQIVSIREVINMPANDIYPEALAQFAKESAEGLPIEVEVWDEARLEKERCGGILSVGKGSVRPPRLVKLTYRGGGKHIALVGKGITFDTGGLSLKPADGMVGMKYDMAGSASVLAVVLGVARLGLKIDVTGFMCLAENMPSGSATRPGDVITIRNGKTVEVLNTDAEGRLVLADGLTLAAELKPDHIIDIATLTGAATIALGNRYAGVMGHGDAVELCLSGAKDAGELLWPMPLPVELRTILDSEIADIANVKIGNRAGGMLVGGQFLADFVPEDQSWAHLDIAGPANNDGAPYSVTPKGASGVMIRSLIAVAQRLAQ